MAQRSRLFLSDLIFRMGTGAFALVLVLIVSGIGLVLWQESRLALEKFGLFAFWGGSSWNPVSGEFGAFPFIWGTLYSSILALLLAGPIALGIAIFLSELCPPQASAATGVPDRTARLHPVDRLRALGRLRAGSARTVAPDIAARVDSRRARLQWSRGRRQPPVGRARAGDHGHPLLVRRGQGGAESRAGVAEGGRLCARLDPLGSDARRPALWPRRHHRRAHARIRPGARRDDGRDDGHRQHAEARWRRCSRPSTPWPR